MEMHVSGLGLMGTLIRDRKVPEWSSLAPAISPERCQHDS